MLHRQVYHHPKTMLNKFNTGEYNKIVRFLHVYYGALVNSLWNTDNITRSTLLNDKAPCSMS